MSEHLPFGLKLGASQSDIKSAVIEMTPLPSSEIGITKFLVYGVPKPIADVEQIVCIFSSSDQLKQVVALFGAIERDPYGAQTRVRYEELKGLLSQRYGEGKETELVSDFHGGESWVYGLFSGVNILGVGFDAKDLHVHLSVLAEDCDTSQIGLTYELVSLKQEIEMARKSQELDAL